MEENILVSRKQLAAIYNMGLSAIFPNSTAQDVVNWTIEFKNIVEGPAHENDKKLTKTSKK